MDNKKGSNKLQLNRETLYTMQSEDLALVHGGATPSTIVPVSIAASRASSAACIRASTEGVKWTARMVSRVTTVVSATYSLVHRSQHCGPTHGGPQPQPQGGGQGGGGGGGGEG